MEGLSGPYQVIAIKPEDEENNKDVLLCHSRVEQSVYKCLWLL